MKKPNYSEPLKNDKHEDFCNEYIIDFHRADAYRRVYGSNFAEKTNVTALARQVLKLPEVIGRISYLKKQKLKDHKLNKKYVLEKWMAIVEDESIHATPKLKALQHIAEHLGMLNQKVDVNHKGSLANKVDVNIKWKKPKKDTDE